MAGHDESHGDAEHRSLHLYLVVGMILLFVLFILGGQLLAVL
ncbi:hypothetical protein [Halorientalis salina]|nr:hypothetical protein [Halorientalis salina]